jgi:hypothetical protein
MTTKNNIIAFKTDKHSFSDQQMNTLIAIGTHEKLYNLPACSRAIAKLLKQPHKKVQVRLSFLQRRGLITVSIKYDFLFSRLTPDGSKVIDEAVCA